MGVIANTANTANIANIANIENRIRASAPGGGV